MEKSLVKASKFVSLVLRHAPDSIGLSLDAQGWAKTTDLIEKSGGLLTAENLQRVVDENNKQRFSFSEDGQFIRANQGHSIPVDLGLHPKEPPKILFHGTATRFLDAIRADGLTSQGRHHVHLSSDSATATSVGTRHGKAVVLIVDAAAMQASGHVFFQSENGVWLTAAVPPEFLSER